MQIFKLKKRLDPSFVAVSYLLLTIMPVISIWSFFIMCLEVLIFFLILLHYKPNFYFQSLEIEWIFAFHPCLIFILVFHKITSFVRFFFFHNVGFTFLSYLKTLHRSSSLASWILIARNSLILVSKNVAFHSEQRPWILRRGLWGISLCYILRLQTTAKA